MVVTSQQREPGVGKKSVEKLVFAMAKPKVSYYTGSSTFTRVHVERLWSTLINYKKNLNENKKKHKELK